MSSCVEPHGRKDSFERANKFFIFNPVNAELNPIYCFLALLGAHHFLHISRIRVKSLTLRLLMFYIYIYGAPILEVSRSHTTTHHSRWDSSGRLVWPPLREPLNRDNTPPTLTLRLLMSHIYMQYQFLMFLDHTQRRTTVGGIPLDVWSGRP
jgi:hypothetical protein